MSKLSSAPLCTPPMPPVAKTDMPARARRDHRGGHGGGPGAARRDAGRHVRAAELGHAAGLRELSQLGGFQPDVQRALDHRDGRGHGTGSADVLLHRAGDLEVLGIGHAVGDDRAFERDDGAAFVAGPAHFGGIGQGRDHMVVSPDT